MYALMVGFLAQALVKQLVSSHYNALRRRSCNSQSLLCTRHTKRLEAEEPSRHGQALLMQYTKIIKGSELARRVCWDYKVSGREWKEASAILLPKLCSRLYHERLGGL
jgi:hypothetical protein